MEDVLELYAEPYDARRPKVNFDETSKQLIKETRQVLPTQPGQPQRYDYEYERAGTRNLFLFTKNLRMPQPLAVGMNQSLSTGFPKGRSALWSRAGLDAPPAKTRRAARSSAAVEFH